MKIFRYWAKATVPLEPGHPDAGVFECHGGSNESIQHALQVAQERARAGASRFASGQFPDRYAYSDRPLREEIIQEFAPGGEPEAIVTRNAYGVLVLNTARVLFADIDLPTSGVPSVVRLLAGLFGRKPAPEGEDVVRRIETVVQETPGLGMRLYRTAAGFRCLVTSRTYQPGDREATELLTRLGSDPLYVKLCQKQDCFRARLTPKPWRCGLPTPPRGFPRSPEVEEIHRQWLARYEGETAGYCTCALIASFGEPRMTREVEPIVAIHDRIACADEKPLA